jgi:sodium-dependent dicarboxylate transporter 2/3/5
MVRTGFGLNLLGVLLIILLSLTWLPFAWGIDVTALPPWAA